MKTLNLFYLIFLCFFSIRSYAYNAGFTEIIHQETSIALWYPSDSKEEDIFYWLWHGKAAENSPVHNGKYPLLIFLMALLMISILIKQELYYQDPLVDILNIHQQDKFLLLAY